MSGWMVGTVLGWISLVLGIFSLVMGARREGRDRREWFDLALKGCGLAVVLFVAAWFLAS